MEDLLLHFINTLDLSLKKINQDVGDRSGFARLTIHQLQYIDAINQLGEPSITEIAEQLKITKASVTTGVNKLLHMGYITKTQSSEDRRVYHVSLTDAGMQLVQAKYRAMREYGEFIRSALSEDEARQFEATIAKLVSLFGQA